MRKALYGTTEDDIQRKNPRLEKSAASVSHESWICAWENLSGLGSQQMVLMTFSGDKMKRPPPACVTPRPGSHDDLQLGVCVVRVNFTFRTNRRCDVLSAFRVAMHLGVGFPNPRPTKTTTFGKDTFDVQPTQMHWFINTRTTFSARSDCFVCGLWDILLDTSVCRVDNGCTLVLQSCSPGVCIPLSLQIEWSRVNHTSRETVIKVVLMCPGFTLDACVPKGTVLGSFARRLQQTYRRQQQPWNQQKEAREVGGGR